MKELAAWLDAPWEGDGNRELRTVAPVDDAGPDDLSFVSRANALKLTTASPAGCLLVPQDFPNGTFPDQTRRTIIRVRDPRAAVARAITKLHPRLEPTPGIHPTAVMGPGSIAAPGCSIGPHAVVGVGVRIGAGTTVGPGAVIGDYVHIGEHCTIHANVTIYRDVTIGHHVILHAGCVIGADGFGYVLTDGVYENFPQIGRVEIGDYVEIGANSCVDRAALGVTSIGAGTKLDNMVHVGHNCRIGRHVAIAAQTGLSGGVVVEDYAVIGGQVGIGDKARIESRAVLGSGSGVLTSKIVRAGQVVWGTPARPLKAHLEQLAVLSRMAKKRKSAE
ncbi:MAG TPA: UDP-3-O-(3-hydroxymyristoyl)glucosamine N-acyltransferase [Bryobacteraceae bacterium]|nr:UDP-3-O-(3-hydroxymyristoyl)glucosamine N-acyltransferase [Bryobacteraceae bacterium]